MGQEELARLGSNHWFFWSSYIRQDVIASGAPDPTDTDPQKICIPGEDQFFMAEEKGLDH